MEIKNTMKAVFEIEFDPEIMIDKETLDEIYDGDWLKFMHAFYGMDGLGIFDQELKLIDVKCNQTKP